MALKAPPCTERARVCGARPPELLHRGHLAGAPCSPPRSFLQRSAPLCSARPSSSRRVPKENFKYSFAYF